MSVGNGGGISEGTTKKAVVYNGRSVLIYEHK